MADLWRRWVAWNAHPVWPVAYTLTLASIVGAALFLLGVLVWRLTHGL